MEASGRFITGDQSMADDSDSDDSHISATPPRKLQAVSASRFAKASVLRKATPPSRRHEESQRQTVTSGLPNRIGSTASSSRRIDHDNGQRGGNLIQSSCLSECKRLDLSLGRDANHLTIPYSHSKRINVDHFTKDGAKEVYSVKIQCQSCHSSASLPPESSDNIPASHFSNLSSISNFSKRRNLSLNSPGIEEATNSSNLAKFPPHSNFSMEQNLPLHSPDIGEAIYSHQLPPCDSSSRVKNDGITVPLPSTQTESAPVTACSKIRGRLPKCITAVVAPSSVARAKAVREGNFVKLNMNGRGRRKFRWQGRRMKSSSSSRSRKSRSKNNSGRKVDSDITSGEEDALIAEQLPQHQKALSLGAGMLDQFILAAREDPSDENLTRLLKLVYGYESFRDGQLVAIKQVVTKRSTMLVLPTGAGKTLCYQIPALILPGITLVICPLVALMIDQLKCLPPALPGGLLSRSQSLEETSATLEQLMEGNIKVLFVSPERFLNEDFMAKCRALSNISLVVIDEAHCLCEWSHNFRPSYFRLKASFFRDNIKADCVLAMTATVTIETLQGVMFALEIPTTHLIKSSQIRENLQLCVTLSRNKMKDVIVLLKSPPLVDVRSIIIYCKFQVEADGLSRHLCDHNIFAKTYHSGIPSKQRCCIQEMFSLNRIRVVVATVAFGMGLNKSDVGAVIHYSLPESLEEYVQEVGRAGRDGRFSYCHLLLDDVTYFKLRSLLHSDGVDEYMVNKLLSEVFKSDVSFPGEIYSLVKESVSQKFDMKEQVILTILTFLEVADVQYLQLLPELKVTCFLQFHKTSPSYLSRQHGWIAAVLMKSVYKEGLYAFDIPTVAKTAEISISCLFNELQKSKLSGEITYEMKNPAFCYRVIKKPDDVCSLASHLTQWLLEAECRKVRKLDAMHDAAISAAKSCTMNCGFSQSLHTSCLQRKILQYFSGESDLQNAVLDKMRLKSKFLHTDIKVFLKSNLHMKFTPRAVARIMHGISSPAYPSAIWSKCHFWGRYIETDFQVIMEAAKVELMNIAGQG